MFCLPSEISRIKRTQTPVPAALRVYDGPMGLFDGEHDHPSVAPHLTDLPIALLRTSPPCVPIATGYTCCTCHRPDKVSCRERLIRR